MVCELFASGGDWASRADGFGIHIGRLRRMIGTSVASGGATARYCTRVM